MKPHIKRVMFDARYTLLVWSRAERGYVSAAPAAALWGVFAARDDRRPVGLSASLDRLALNTVFAARACGHGGARA